MMAEQTDSPTQEFEYQAEMQHLLHLIVNSLYTHPEIFLRELISNASDALNKIRFRQLTDSDVLDPDATLEIRIRVDPKEQTFEIEDTGIGMTQADLIDRIGTVASSGTMEFVKQLREAESSPGNADWIGKFGVGFYSVFMVTDEVTIETRHADLDSKGYRWRSYGQSKFTIEESDREARGTKVSFKLKDDAQEFAYDYKIRTVIEKYSNFVDFPISVGEDKVNTVSALWHRNKDEVTDEDRNEFYKFVSNDLNDPMGCLHLSMEGLFNFKALIFIPAKAPPDIFREAFEKSVHLYSNRVFIQDDCRQLLPEHLRFVRGVVDTEDLPLNVSREVTQSSSVMAKIRNALTDKILGLLEGWARDEAEKYESFHQNFGSILKTGLNTDSKNKERIVELLRFESSKTESGKTTSLRRYVEGIQDVQEEIYYLMGENRETVENDPKLEYFRKKDLEVLFLLDPVDVFIIHSLEDYDGKPVKTVEKADIDLKQDEEGRDSALSDEEADALIAFFKEMLGDRVADVRQSKRLVDSVATLVVGEDGLDTRAEQVMKMMNAEFKGSKKILELNTAHPLIRNLHRIQQSSSGDEALANCVWQIFEGALLMEGNLESEADFVARMTDIMVRATN